MPKKTPLEKLDADIRVLDKDIKNSNSLWRSFIRGLASGTGTAIGASVVAAIIVTLLFQFLRTAEGFPLLNNLFSAIGLENIINSHHQNHK